MASPKILSNSTMLEAEFTRCCREYSAVSIAVAWCGDPQQQVLPYKHLEGFHGDIVATIGVSFNQTHPEGIKWLVRLGAQPRIVCCSSENPLFHPKLYLFTRGERFALFAGSSNLTYGGFYKNFEVNVLIEDTFANSRDVLNLKRLLETWRSDDFSFVPNESWIAIYEKQYSKEKKKRRDARLDSPSAAEQRFGGASWLQEADWKTYYTRINEGLNQQDRSPQKLHRVLDAAQALIPTPWQKSYFGDPEKRRIIGGWGEYGPFGFVAAAGTFGHLLKSGRQKWNMLANTVNEICKLQPRIDLDELESLLSKLVSVGNSMQVWGRVLCLIRPDLFCSVSSRELREKLASTLGCPSNSFATPDGYTQLILFLHSSSWFRSERPSDREEASIWDRRVAFMDAIFWTPKREKRAARSRAATAH